MRKYRSRPPLAASRPRSDDGWDDFNMMEKNITVYEQEPAWQQLGILGPDGQPIEYMDCMEPIGFLWHLHEEGEDDV